MITLEIPEVTYTDSPNDPPKRMTDLDKFLIGFRKLCEVTSMSHADVGGFKACPIVTVLRFGDGTSIGIRRLFEEVGFTFKENN